VQFESTWDYSSGILDNTALNIINPVGGNGTATGFEPQGRYTNTYQIGDSALERVSNRQLGPPVVKIAGFQLRVRGS
jgi:hypothetical protein